MPLGWVGLGWFGLGVKAQDMEADKASRVEEQLQWLTQRQEAEANCLAAERTAAALREENGQLRDQTQQLRAALEQSEAQLRDHEQQYQKLEEQWTVKVCLPLSTRFFVLF